ncbi:N-acetyltransferase family protein (plasmid) [Rhodanobacter sp. UC4439_H6]|jgi:GNAT superfamily N-acetyltransferase
MHSNMLPPQGGTLHGLLRRKGAEMQRDTFFQESPFGVVRDARQADTPCILGLVSKLAEHHGDTMRLTADALMQDAFAEPPWVHILVAEIDQKVVGYAALCPLIQLHFGVRGLDMHHLLTDADHRGRGVGKGLVEACKMKAKMLSCGYLAVGTHPDNRAAQEFYEAIGFLRRDSHPQRFSLRLSS